MSVKARLNTLVHRVNKLNRFIATEGGTISQREERRALQWALSQLVVLTDDPTIHAHVRRFEEERLERKAAANEMRQQEARCNATR
jgi:hypothetical protein